MNSLSSHLSVLEAAASRYPDRPAFRIAKKSKSTDSVEAWLPITFKDFLGDVELASRYWSRKFALDGLAPRSVVGAW